MKLLDKKTSADLTRLLVFIVVTTLATGVLVVTIGNLSFQGSKDYQAVFADVTGMNKGDDVRIAGVKVGTVGDIEAIASDADEDGAQARVTFSVQDGTALRESTHATIRYRNLVGQRYIALTEDVGSTTELDPGDTIPMEQTTPALDLTLLFNGFKPLFEALSPDDLNKLSFEVIQVFQGQGGTLESLLESTASVTQTLADRDAIIGQLLENLDFVLDRLADRDEQLSATIISFRDLVAGLRKDRNAILDSLDGITRLSTSTADLVTDLRAPFVEDIKQLRRLTKNLDDGKAEIDRALQVLPIKLEKVGRTAIYGSWFNFYLCDFKGRVSLPGVTVPVDFNVGAERCDLG
ncbi:MCE family protein [Nocardioides sp.]|jgi:phospholipid/cholesterol/gamma-HCH transport system substrate-binding protein|uniref:MCE family protein n=1 Tax=Nocardioides sp. TaxID=35761 RepID=UPI001D5AADB7|nr:MCE family protein [Nocardioides sp.]MBU1801429.1 MCE family protein [Actinomycetota bacterium]